MFQQLFLVSLVMVSSQGIAHNGIRGLSGEVKDVVVDTSSGPIRGVEKVNVKTGKAITAFYGIPFAEPPVDRLRFALPVPHANWTNPWDATTKERKLCPQLPNNTGHLGQEDCLYMNIYVPAAGADISKSNFPSFFWIFGGGFMAGDNDELDWYDGESLSLSQNVIVVEPNYRIGTLGFLATRALKNESGGSTGNYGVQDQQLAMKWFHTNVKNFGGSQQRIAIAGESAGAFSVCWHYVSSVSRKYFTAAIMQSGTCQSAVFFVSLPRALTFGKEVALHVGCDVDDLTCLRSKPYSKFFMHNDFKPLPIPGTNKSIIPPLSAFMPWGPTIDKDTRGLLARPIELLQSMNGKHIPIIMGSNLDEGTLFLEGIGAQAHAGGLPFSDRGVESILRHFFNDSTMIDVQSFYKEFKGTNDDKIAAILRDFFFTCANRKAAERLTESGVKVYLYQFVMKLGLWADYIAWGDYHTLEISFVFNNPWPPILHTFGPREHKMADHFGKYWATFAASGAPNGDDLLGWPKYNRLGRPYMKMDQPLKVAHNLEENTCKFWEHRYEKFYFE